MQETQVWSLDQEDPLEKEMQPTPAFLPGKSHGQRTLMVAFICYSVKDTDHVFALLHKCLCSEPTAVAQHGFIERINKRISKWVDGATIAPITCSTFLNLISAMNQVSVPRSTSWDRESHALDVLRNWSREKEDEERKIEQGMKLNKDMVSTGVWLQPDLTGSSREETGPQSAIRQEADFSQSVISYELPIWEGT